VVGLWLLSAGHRSGLVFLACQLAMTVDLLKGTGTAMTDKRMHSSPRGFAGYVERTSGCVPRPPRRSAPHRDRRQSPH
jgi:steroid 5-alpha reductase family enzyme